MTGDDVKRLQLIAYETDVLSLNVPLRSSEGEASDEVEFGDMISVSDNCFTRLDQECIHNMIIAEISKLESVREQHILRLRFGLDDGEPKTLEEIGKKFSVTRERIRQIEKKALHHLRQQFLIDNLKYTDF